MSESLVYNLERHGYRWILPVMEMMLFALLGSAKPDLILLDICASRYRWV
jgi:hypothetical protein